MKSQSAIQITMRITFALFLWLCSPLTLVAEENYDDEALLIVNSINITQTLPLRFRSTADISPLEVQNFSLAGLETLNASASAQFSVEELRALLRTIKGKSLIIVDLRKEPHGFINQYAVSWYTPGNWLNADAAIHEALLDEQERLKNAFEQQELIMHKIIEKNYDTGYATMIQLPVSAHYVQTEEELCRHLNVRYARLPVVDHMHPASEVVDKFVELTKNLSPHCWPHFHCKAGQGRASTFLAMYDILRHAGNVSFEDILYRQHALGGINLFQIPPLDYRKYHHFVERRQFLIKFYHYCRDEGPDFKISWSEWESKHHSLHHENAL